MSVSISKAVWERAQARGTDLVILLCLADFADENGVAAPSVATIAHQARILPRSVAKCLAKLKRSGQIREAGRGPKGGQVPGHPVPRHGCRAGHPCRSRHLSHGTPHPCPDSFGRLARPVLPAA